MGAAILAIASTFLGKGLIPCLVIQNPKYSVLDFPQNDLVALTLSPAFFNLVSTASNLIK
jgi:hypothetical protein